MKCREGIEKLGRLFLKQIKGVVGRDWAIKFEIKPICVYSVTGKTRVNDTGEETFGLLCFAEITEFAKELHSEMEKVVLMDELPENWTYPLIQPKLIENKENLKLY